MQKYSYLLIILTLIACAPPKPKAPKNMLSQSQMSDILTEMHIADAIATTNYKQIDSINQAGVNYREFIYTKYQTNHQQFTESFDFYKQNPVLLDSVYAEVVTKLSSKEMQFRGK